MPGTMLECWTEMEVGREMAADVGEYIVGAYLTLKLDCDAIEYNVRPPGGGMKGLGELDVVGYDFKTGTVYLCEVTTHIRGLDYGSSRDKSIATIRKKHERQKAYADAHRSSFPNRRYMFWSPVVPESMVADLSAIGIELFINQQYTVCVLELQVLAQTLTHDINNPFFRTLQILASLKR